MFRLPPCKAGPDELTLLFQLMERRRGKAGQNPHVPAGFTYLGQFIDHDITFDPMSKLDEPQDPESLVNFRTPRLDLDSLYGGGPGDQPFLYDWPEKAPGGTKLLLGGKGPVPKPASEDLPRNEQGRALIGDPRNDEHVIISQLHLLFIRFHNAVVDHLLEKNPKDKEPFEEAQRIVRWHYQWIVVHEFLPKVVGEGMVNKVLVPPVAGGRPQVRRRFYKWRREPFIPVEFSGAAYRFGHSMARARYRVRGKRPEEEKEPKAIPLFNGLQGLSWLPEDLVISWDLFFDLKGLGGQVLATQPSFAIDTSIAPPLYQLPEGKGALPSRNLRRGADLSLPSGQRVAKRMRVRALSEKELQLDELPAGKARELLLRSTPLWYYILCEAATTLNEEGQPTKDSHLGPVGGRIVTEVIIGLLEGDPTSYLNAKDPWQPGELGTRPAGNALKFEMIDLIKFAGAAPA
jgi:Animal haem peroxidase